MRRPRRPRVYRISVETYLIALALAFALAVAFSLFSAPKEIAYRLPHRFAVGDDTFLPSSHALSNPWPIEGSHVRLLENGDEIYPAMLAAIALASRSINLETYIFWSGQAAGRFRDAFEERARSGAEVGFSWTRSDLEPSPHRGVDVRVLVPGKVNDVPATKAGGRSSFGGLLEGGRRFPSTGRRCSTPRQWSWMASSPRSARPISTTGPFG